MEEPQIINYYQSLPEYAIVIENLNEEYEELISNYIQLSERIQPYIPIHQTKDIYFYYNLLFLFMIIIILETSIIFFILI